MYLRKILNSNLVCNVFDSNSKALPEKALHYALICTLSVSSMAFIASFLDVPLYMKLFFIFASWCFVFYGYGNTLKQQCLMIVFGCLCISILSFIGVFLGEYLWLIGIFLFIVSFALYFYSSINTGALYIAKLGMVVLSFVVIGLPGHSIVFAWNIFWMEIFGGFLVLCSSIIIYILFGYKRTPDYFLKKWEKSFVSTLNAINESPELTKHDLSEFLSINKFMKSHLSSDNFYVLQDKDKHIELSIILENISSSFNLLTNNINENPCIKKSLWQISKGFFECLIESFEKGDSSILSLYHEKLKNNILCKQEQGFFATMKPSLRKKYTEYFLLIENILTESISLFNLKINYYHKSNFLKDIKKLILKGWSAVKSQKAFDGENFSLSFNTKFALRASIAITSSFIFACFYGEPVYAPWIILSCNVVLLSRQGDTVKKFIVRLGGTIFGFGFALILGWWVWPYFSTGYFWVPFLMFCASYSILANYFCFSFFLIIYIVYVYSLLIGPSFAQFPTLSLAVTRLIDVCIGGGFAFIAGFFIFKNLGIEPNKQRDYDFSLSLFSYIKDLKYFDKNKNKNLYEKNLVFIRYITESKAKFQSLEFQVEGYKKNVLKQKKIFYNQVELFENLSFLDSRLNNINFNKIVFTPELKKLYKKHISDISNNLLLVIDKFWFPELSNKNLNKKAVLDSLKKTNININESILDAFAMTDARKLSYDYLINYVSICIVLEKINKSLYNSIF